MSSLNGQLWMIRSEDYARFNPHSRFRNRVLEDVATGKFLSSNGMHVHLHDFRRQFEVSMYSDLRDAWRGFGRTSALLLDGRPILMLPVLVTWLILMVIPLFLDPLLVVALYCLKLLSDRYSGYPLWITAAAPLSLLLGGLVLLYSLFAHLRGDVTWKDRSVLANRDGDMPSTVVH